MMVILFDEQRSEGLNPNDMMALFSDIFAVLKPEKKNQMNRKYFPKLTLSFTRQWGALLNLFKISYDLSLSMH